ncbi:phosphopantothenate--cysteine ligase family flavoprotein [Lewinella sp. 4G2]|uniref:bifunctional phosphopantothenoylcysteine decarboxylase/phosphopantothenate synthase n=1 Tax=Lewinella sp. 4G2 TaxID=1803372 RepID=UPI0007B4ADC9|nr:bifunctional phosphopantothenoylcysteine decarboxylase/phosphopantothenate synthase [Lewinella sp. 4G2]OAV44515.1 phosphopantothenoylcysteine decarboxylase [Lewinella sp. 4G2]
MSLAGKKIILGVSGSIAAYKAALIVRGLVKAGAEVKVLMTRAATDFISPLTLATLSKNDVTTSVHDGESWNNHVELGLWADAMLISPATATTLGKMASAICDNAIVAVYLSARCPVFFAPAMDLDMWAHPATQRNVELLKAYGNHLIDVGDGELASGLSGAGRLAEPEDILQILSDHFADPGAAAGADGRVGAQEIGKGLSVNAEPAPQTDQLPQDLAGKRILITAGPTYEDLDPVRYLGNRSTGRMGIALADAATQRGARVDLVLGPTTLSATEEGVNVIPVRTAREMHAASVALWHKADAAVLAAAVADYRPRSTATQKIKKKDGPLRLELVRNPDIAAELGEDKKAHQRLVGFALETDNGIENARRKLSSKHLDFIVLNSPSEEGTGFGHTTNRVQFVTKEDVQDFELKPKTEVATDILNALVELL